MSFERISAGHGGGAGGGPRTRAAVPARPDDHRGRPGVLDEWRREALDALELRPLLCRPEHIAAIYHLPPVHHDPFDRALIAQAIVEGLALVTTGREIARYACEGLRVIR